MDIVISEFMDEPAVQRLREQFSVLYDPGLVDRPLDLQSALARSPAMIVRNRTQVNQALLEHAPRLQVVGRLGVGLDNIEQGPCRDRGVQVIPATGANARAVAEYVLGASLLLARGAFGSTRAVASGQWPRTALGQGREIDGLILGLIGFGDIARQLSAMAGHLGLSVLAHDPGLAPDDPAWAAHRARPLALDELLAQADIVSLHVPLLPSTRGLIDARRLEQMKPDAILINTARGGVVDEAAVAAALRAGRLGGAALDVFDEEPLPCSEHLQDVPNLILSPHIAGLSRQANTRVSAFVADAIARQLRSPS